MLPPGWQLSIARPALADTMGVWIPGAPPGRGLKPTSTIGVWLRHTGVGRQRPMPVAERPTIVDVGFNPRIWSTRDVRDAATGRGEGPEPGRAAGCARAEAGGRRARRVHQRHL